MVSRRDRVRKACARCRMKKMKCDGEMPCKRCRDDSAVCAASIRKKRETKAAPRGYVEVLECSQLVLVATIHKLYAMVRNQQKWEYGEPKLNDRSQPVIQDIAARLGCIHPLQDLDISLQMTIPEDRVGMAGVARQLEQMEREDKDKDKGKGHEMYPLNTYSPARSSSPEPDELEEQDPSAAESEASRQSFVGSDMATSSGYRERAFEELEFDEFPFPQDSAIDAFSGHVLEVPGYPPAWTTSTPSFASAMGVEACIADGNACGSSGFDERVANTTIDGADGSDIVPMDMLLGLEDSMLRKRS